METKQTFGEVVRDMRKQRSEPLRVVAAALEIDSTLLSKIERGERFPTATQLIKFADYFQTGIDKLTALLIADKVMAEYGYQPATLQAAQIIKGRISSCQTK